MPCFARTKRVTRVCLPALSAARGGINVAPMEYRSRRVRRKRSPSRRRRVAPRRPYLSASLACLAVVAAFLAGWIREDGSSRTLPETAVSTRAANSVIKGSAEREAALDAFDEAVRARHEKRMGDALAALARARQADPDVPGYHLLSAELALAQQQFPELRAASEAARAEGQYAAAAFVLLGIDTWLARGTSDNETLSAADRAGAYFAEATAADFFNAPAWLYWSDVLRLTGGAEKGHNDILGSLHRLHPWDSSGFLSAKLLLALDRSGAPSSVEAGERADFTGPSSQALAGLLRALAAGSDPAPAVAQVRATYPDRQARQLLGDLKLAETEAGDSGASLVPPDSPEQSTAPIREQIAP